MFFLKSLAGSLAEELRKQRLSDPMVLMEQFAAFEKELGISGVADFYNAPPITFVMPRAEEYRGRVYSEEYYARIVRNIPAFAGALQRLFGSALGDTAYATLLVRWPEHQPNWKSEGLSVHFGCDHLLFLPGNHPKFARVSDGMAACTAISSIRGPFEYTNQFAVFAVALPVARVDEFFRFPNGPWLKDNVTFPPDLILGMVPGPTAREQELLEQTVRAYWRKLALLGYKAVPKYSFREQSQDPLIGEIPEVLSCPDSEPAGQVGLGDCWGVCGTLETWHRLSKVNRLIDEHKRSVAAPAVNVLRFGGRGIRRT